VGVLNDGPHNTVAVDAAGATDPTNGFVREAVGPLLAEPNVTHEAEGANESITFQENNEISLPNLSIQTWDQEFDVSTNCHIVYKW